MGLCGYVKANKLTAEYIIRQDMKKREDAKTISFEEYNNRNFELIENNITKKINIKTIFNITENNIEINNEQKNTESNKIWVVISNKTMGKQINSILEEYKNRTGVIDTIVKEAIEYNINGVIVDFEEIEEKETIKRFIIELTPKLREVGIDTCVVLNKNFEKNDYINIVDYIIE